MVLFGVRVDVDALRLNASTGIGADCIGMVPRSHSLSLTWSDFFDPPVGLALAFVPGASNDSVLNRDTLQAISHSDTGRRGERLVGWASRAGEGQHLGRNRVPFCSDEVPSYR